LSYTGKRRHLINVQRRSEGHDPFTGPSGVWETIFRRWSDIEPAGPSDYTQGNQVYATVTHTVTMPHGDVLPTDRLTYGSRKFEIVGTPLNQGERDRTLKILAKETY